MPLLVESSVGTSFSQEASHGSAIKLIRVARERWAAGSQSPGRTPPWWTLGLVLSGSLRLHRLPQSVQPGYLFFSAPGDYRRMTAQGDGPLELLLCAFYAESVDFIPDNLHKHGFLAVEDVTRVGRCFQALIEEARPADALAHEMSVHHLHLTLLTAQQVGANDSEEQRARAHFATAKALFTEGWDRIAGVDEVADHCGISHAWLCRLFKRYAGCTPRQYWMQQRILAAADRLWRDEIPLSEIAEDVGFADQFAFSKAFKRVLGVPPSTWLARVRREGS